MLVQDQKMEDFIGKRKHCSQMTQFEIDNLYARLRSVEERGNKWRIAGHALDRIQQKGIRVGYDDIVSNIHNSNMVEYKIDENRYTGEAEERVVLVSKALVNRCYRFKAVYNLTERRIITVWINHIKDNHSTLDWSIYTEDMPVFGI